MRSRKVTDRKHLTHHDGVSARQIPITPSYPFELHHVKALFLARQYKECIRRCEEIRYEGEDKMEAAHIIFLNFYTALSHESLANLMHKYSVSRLPECCAAESAYLKALEVCKSGAHPLEFNYFSPHPSLQRVSVQHRHTKAIAADIRAIEDTPNSVITNVVDDEEKRASRINFSWPRTSAYPQDGENQETSSMSLYLLPDEAIINFSSPQNVSPQMALSLHPKNTFETPSKLSRSFSQSDAMESSIYHTCISKAPQSAGIKHNDNKYTTSGNTNEGDPNTPIHPNTPSNIYLSPVHPLPKPTYTSHLTAFETQLHTHLIQVRALKHETITAQSQRMQRRTQSLLTVPTTNSKPALPHSRSFWSFKDPVAEMAEKNERIEEGRARGWVFERFAAEKYVRLAGDAMAELGERS